VAVNCVVAPTFIDALVGDKEIEVTTGAILTDKVALALNPLYAAEMVALPTAAPVANPGVGCPGDSTVAVVVLEEVHVAEPVTLLLDPSL